ncbi:terminase B [Paenibacillus sp. JJ1722]|uniref:terminase B n=1 Tax=Paenibacillus sp. JJ1722 TaxID=3398770 RepID=UPI003AACBA13
MAKKVESLTKRMAAFKKRMPVYRKSPKTFFKEILNFSPDKWQESVSADIAKHRFVSVRSGQGVGKTALEAAISLWFLCCFPFPRVVCTAPTRQQLNDVLWAEISKWQSQSPILKRILKWTKTKIYMKNYEERWFATARTATKPENMQGFHEDYMLFIVDEASGVDDRIMAAIFGTLSGDYNKLFMCGNPTKTSGFFFDSHNRDRAIYRTHRVSCLDSPRTSKENIEMLKTKYGEGSDVWRVRVLGEFPRGESDTFIALEAAEFAKDEVKMEPYGTKLFVGVDVARFGDDETTMYARMGGKVIKTHFHHKQDTMTTTGWVLRLVDDVKAERSEVDEVEIRIDDSGIGGAVTDRLNEINEEKGLGYTIIPVNNGSAAKDAHYGNLGAEQWGHIKEMLESNMSNYVLGKSGDLQLPDDEKLITQLTTRKWRMGSNGKIFLERKEDMKKRGLQSPDRADGFVLAFANIEKDNGFSFG